MTENTKNIMTLILKQLSELNLSAEYMNKLHNYKTLRELVD
jgi:hypothetical protein